MVILERIFLKKLIMKQNQQTTKNHGNYLVGKELIEYLKLALRYMFYNIELYKLERQVLL